VNRLVWWALGTSILLLVAVPISVVLSRPEDEVGSLEALRRTKVPAPAEAGLGGLGVPMVRVRSGLLASRSTRRDGDIPERLRIGAIDVDAPILPVGVTAGTTQIPADVHEVGWYRFGGRPGTSGSTLLVAHVSSGTQGPGVFFRLRDLVPGDDVVVEMRDGSSSVFRVIARWSYAKEALPDRLFDRTGPAMLALVTCGGPYSQATGRYEDNIVVYAVPRGTGA
jgi:sortase (surface protein transpeptidase)